MCLTSVGTTVLFMVSQADGPARLLKGRSSEVAEVGSLYKTPEKIDGLAGASSGLPKWGLAATTGGTPCSTREASRSACQ